MTQFNLIGIPNKFYAILLHKCLSTFGFLGKSPHSRPVAPPLGKLEMISKNVHIKLEVSFSHFMNWMVWYIGVDLGGLNSFPQPILDLRQNSSGNNNGEQLPACKCSVWDSISYFIMFFCLARKRCVPDPFYRQTQ